MGSQLRLRTRDGRLGEDAPASGYTGKAGEPEMLIGHAHADGVDGRMAPPASREYVASRALDVSRRRKRVRDRDRIAVRVGAGCGSGPRVDVHVRADLVTVAVGPVD